MSVQVFFWGQSRKFPCMDVARAPRDSSDYRVVVETSVEGAQHSRLLFGWVRVCGFHAELPLRGVRLRLRTGHSAATDILSRSPSKACKRVGLNLTAPVNTLGALRFLFCMCDAYFMCRISDATSRCFSPEENRPLCALTKAMRIMRCREATCFDGVATEVDMPVNIIGTTRTVQQL